MPADWSRPRRSWPAGCGSTSWCSPSPRAASAPPTGHSSRSWTTTCSPPFCSRARRSGRDWRRGAIRSTRSAPRCAPASVRSICARSIGLARELYTYEGSGTLFTLEDYCRIERLGIDDFEEVERLIARGQREGYLKPRSPIEVARILLNGFGAEIGSHHFAGVCGLETAAFAPDRVGEIVGLYTITRFKGEGVGGRLLERVARGGRGGRPALRLRLHARPACRSLLRARGISSRDARRRAGGEVGRLRSPTARPYPRTAPGSGVAMLGRARTIGIVVAGDRRGGADRVRHQSPSETAAISTRRSCCASAIRATRCTISSSSSRPPRCVPRRRGGRRRPARAERRDPDAGRTTGRSSGKSGR